MKRIASLSGLLALVFVGCGLISSPPIDNPFGLRGEQSTINLQAATGNATATATFNDITLNSLTLRLHPPVSPTTWPSQTCSLAAVAAPRPCPAASRSRWT
jgi:hypothetical protein